MNAIGFGQGEIVGSVPALLIAGSELSCTRYQRGSLKDMLSHVLFVLNSKKRIASQQPRSKLEIKNMGSTFTSGRMPVNYGRAKK